MNKKGLKKRIVTVDFTDVEPPDFLGKSAPYHTVIPIEKREENQKQNSRFAKIDTTKKKPARQKRVPQYVVDMFAHNVVVGMENLLELMDSRDTKVKMEATKFFMEKCMGKDFSAFAPMQNADEDNELTVTLIHKKKEDEPG